ncbi:MAG: helix-turn-helix transcriptional regulator [Marinibacterium sp.]
MARYNYGSTRPRGRFVRIYEVSEMIGLSPRTIQRLAKKGDFPPPIKISERVVGWTEAMIQDWMHTREKDAWKRYNAEARYWDAE